MVITRTTDITQPTTTFIDGSNLIAADLNNQALQNLFAAQEAEDDVTILGQKVNTLALATGQLPPVTNDNQFLVTSAGHWTVINKTDLQTLFGVSGSAGTTLPAPINGNMLIASASAYILQDSRTGRVGSWIGNRI